MKRTRVVFGLESDDPIVSKTVAEALGNFKGTEIIEHASAEKINNAFLKNRSAIIIRDESNFDSLPAFWQYIPIRVTMSSALRGNVIALAGNNLERQFQTIANRYNIDIGDSITADNRTEEGTEDCFFCKLFIGLIQERIRVYQSDNFLVVPGKGAFYSGYFMILPKRHIMSFAELTADEHREFLTVIEDTKFILSEMYNMPILFWENGSGEDGRSKSKNSIVHAHGHLMPVNDEYNICEDTFFNGVPLTLIDIDTLSQYSKPSYLLVLNPKDNSWYMKTSQDFYIPRQFVRQLLCEDLLGDNVLWDWRVYPLWDQVDQNAIEFLDYVRFNYSSLSERIRKRTAKFI